MKINIFLSYSLGDLDLFKIDKIADLLREKPEIGKVMYWHKDDTGDPVQFMYESIEKLDIMFVFCSKRTVETKGQQMEWSPVLLLDKVIIPVYHKLDHIPTIIKQFRGIEFDFLDFEGTFNLIYTLVQNNLPKFIDRSIDKINLFLSYSLKDFDDFKIEKIADLLREKSEIGNVMYWHKDDTGDLIQFMDESVKKCDIMLIFCSERTVESKAQKADAKTAAFHDKVIIPVFHKLEHIPLLIRSNRGIELDFVDFDETVDGIYILVLENMHKALKNRKSDSNTHMPDNFRDLGDLGIKEQLQVKSSQKASELVVERKNIDTSSQNGELTTDSEIEPPFDAYEGTEPYLFVSYAHLDKELVYPIIDELNKQGVRIWYDEGIPAASDWIAEIADTIINSTCFLVFLTPRALKSEHVRDEIHLAKDEQKKMFIIYLEDTDLPPDIRLQIGRKQALFRHKMNEERFWRKLRNQLSEVISKPPRDKSPEN